MCRANERNEGELSSKYYDPELNRSHHSHEKHSTSPDTRRDSTTKKDTVYPSRSSPVVGPTLPSAQDLQLHHESLAEQREAAHERDRLDRKASRRLEKERLNELIPRADPGTREAKLQKKAEMNAANRAFREKSPEVTVSDATLMGGDDIVNELLREKAREREREDRARERDRVKEMERLKRRSELEKREDSTMEMLKKMAAERWGNKQ
jgi:hypothetical protein